MVTSPVRGEIYWAEMDPVVGHEQGGRRPVLVVQNDAGNEFSPTTIVAAITRARPRRPYPFMVPLPATALASASVVNCAQLRTVDRSRLQDGRLATLDAATMARVDEALRASLGLKR
ncbi:MAG: type II toxin-antitoxin system PemK/MazF family toxin [Coriobacteriia bacterium]|nr:type II toxin-antitoxin system PemK/MazF family toxin [Coriobacteriia bacterium]